MMGVSHTKLKLKETSCTSLLWDLSLSRPYLGYASRVSSEGRLRLSHQHYIQHSCDYTKSNRPWLSLGQNRPGHSTSSSVVKIASI